MGSNGRHRVCLGTIVAAHGIRGAVKVKTFTAEPHAVAAYGPLEDETASRRFALTVIGTAKGGVLARLDGVDDRNAAEALRGVRLYVDRAALPAPATDEFYHADLLGLEAVLRGSGEVLGRVVAVHDFGAGDSLEIERVAGGTILVPFTEAAVPVVDVAAGRLDIEPLPGLLDTRPVEADLARESAA